MSEPFSTTVRSARWRAVAEAWAGERLAEHGVAAVGPVTQPRVRAWAAQLVVPTDDGPAWLKAACPGLAHEPAVHAALARALPDDVDEPLAIDPERGWMLTRDRGATLAERREPDLATWQDLVRRAARIQRSLADVGDPLLRAGLPDCSPATVPDRLGAVLARLSALPETHPSALDPARARALAATGPRVAAAAGRLARTPVPASLQHGDLHPANVFVVDDGLRIFDFGDAQWAHPAEVLVVPRRILATTGLPWEPVLAAWAGEWADLADPDTVAGWVADAALTQPVNRAVTWSAALADATDDELAEWGDAPVRTLDPLLPGTG